MATLGCKIRGNTSPQGKPRVYFCCHPADFSLYFDGISDELLARQNCAVFYPEGGAAVYDETLLADLAQMQLFVMPVTARLLTTDDPALTVAFPFAIAHHIPVLPLLQESGLDALFNEKCGDLQYLDSHNTDPTAIPYEEKLTHYLDTVLVGDELAAQVRAAFDAYIFLSYRKKDRHYAQELMRLIHRNAFCRDIAIWYDEFLTPGEDFNEAIRQALEKSGLFVLAVTPNLVNEPNYIQQIEYPLAVEQGKIILPAEMVPTDRQALTEKYAHIPPCADAHDAPTLTAALSATLLQLAVRENDSDPQHNFFIGLAYLGGIDVEMDHARAVELITGAAEAGLKDAVKKLVTMYREGVGVARDYEEAIRWQKQLADALEAEYVAEPTQESRHTLARTLLDLGNFIKEASRPEEARQAYERLRVLCEDEACDSDTAVYLLLAYSCLGDVSRAVGDLATAKRWYEKLLDIAEDPATPNRFFATRMLAQSCDGLSDLCLENGEPKAAREWAETGLFFREKLLADVPDSLMELTRQELCVSYHRLGNLCRAAGNLPAAIDWYEQARQPLEQQLRKGVELENLRRNVYACYLSLGNCALDSGDLESAIRYYQNGVALVERELEQTGSLTAQRDMSYFYENIAIVFRKNNELAASRGWAIKCLGVRSELAEKTRTMEDFDLLAQCFLHLALVCTGAEQKEHLRSCLELSRAMAEKYPQMTAFSQRAQACQNALRELE